MMSNSKSDFSYKITVDHEKRITFVNSFINGKKAKTPIYVAQDVIPYTVAEACRTAAFQLLEKADEIQHSKEFYHHADIQKQIELMKYENRSIFSKEDEDNENHPYIRVWSYHIYTHNDGVWRGLVRDISEECAKKQLLKCFDEFKDEIKDTELYLLPCLSGNDIGTTTF